MYPPVPPIDLSQLPGWLVSVTTLAGLLTFIVWPFLQWLQSRWPLLKNMGQFGLDVILGVMGLLLYWIGVWLSTVLTPDVIKSLQPYYAGIPVILGILMGLKLGRGGVAMIVTSINNQTNGSAGKG